MGADLGHQEDLVAVSVAERSAQDCLSLAVVILPGVVEHSNGEALVGVCRDGGCAGHRTRTDFKKVPSSRIHLYASWRPACTKCESVYNCTRVKIHQMLVPVLLFMFHKQI